LLVYLQIGKYPPSKNDEIQLTDIRHAIFTGYSFVHCPVTLHVEVLKKHISSALVIELWSV